MSHEKPGLSRRHFLAGSAAALGAAALGPPRGLAAGTDPAAARDPAIEQIARILGGWDLDTAAGLAAWKADGRPPEAPAATDPAARIFLRRSHAIQAAMQAEAAGAPPPSIVAALLHDIGHVFSAPAPAGREADYDDRHELVGALWLRNVFVPEVSEPVLHHVPAKRYLVTTRSEYWEHLAQDSRDSLMRQGGRMGDDELEAFRALPHWDEGVRVRIWDDDAKTWTTELAPLEHWVPHMEACLR